MCIKTGMRRIHFNISFLFLNPANQVMKNSVQSFYLYTQRSSPQARRKLLLLLGMT